jgi:hypothetical protein
MVSERSVRDQLKGLGFKHTGWGRTEVRELYKIILPEEEIFEVVNGFYEGGFALLIASDIRVLLVDKKPMNYLNVEDLRFDMINEMDYSHRLIGATISIATGNKTLRFTSLNQARLRKLIGHVQGSMAQTKKKQNSSAEDQKSHLEQINQQLQAYLVAQHQHQLKLEEIQRAQQSGTTPPPIPEMVQPSPELSEFLKQQSMLAQYQARAPQTEVGSYAQNLRMDELYAEAYKEVFGKANQQAVQPSTLHIPIPGIPDIPNPLEINPMRIAYSKLPMALRNRKFGRPSFHAHSGVPAITQATPEAESVPTG